MNLSNTKILFSLILLFACLQIFPQAHPDSAYMKIDVSNMAPEVNEEVQIKLEFELTRDYNECMIFLFVRDSVSMQIIEGQTYWREPVKKGAKIKKDYVLKFLEKKIFELVFHIQNFNDIYGFDATIDIPVGGAFKESGKVWWLKNRVQMIKELNDDSDTVKAHFSPSYRRIDEATWVRDFPDMEDPDKINETLSQINDSTLSPELQRKNEDLYKELMKEYKKLYAIYSSKKGRKNIK